MSQPTPSELLHHYLTYEFEMLRDTLGRIGQHGDPVVTNALIESFCVHARTLLEFFEKDRGARAYANPGYTPFAGGDAGKRAQIVRKLNNQISHLMDGRTADPALKIGPADRAEMFAILSAEYANFKAHLLPTHAAPGAPIMLKMGDKVTATNQVVMVTTPGPTKSS